LAVKVAQGVLHGFPYGRSRQQATPMAAIQLQMQLVRLALLEGAPPAGIDRLISLIAPRGVQTLCDPMRRQPGFPLLLPGQQDPARNGVSQAKRNKIGAPILPPMGQIPSV